MAGNEVTRFIRNETIQKRIEDLLDKRAGQFTTSLITAVNANERLAHCKPETVLNAALTAASMDLPLNPNLGFAALVPYGNECQFQMMWRGFVQLAQRSRQYRTISATAVYEGQLKSNDPLRGVVFDFEVAHSPGDKPIGYASYFELLNGFEKTLYMTYAEVEAHGRKYSKNFKGVWSDNFEAMALKTVLKLLISRFGPMSTEMETAITKDQAVIRDNETVYVDNDKLEDEKATEDQKKAIVEANTITVEVTGDPSPDELDAVKEAFPGAEVSEMQAALPIEPKQSVKERAAAFAEKGKAINAEKKAK